MAPQPQVYCPNLSCAAPLNDFGKEVCTNCQTPLIYRYVWAIGEAVLHLPVDSLVEGRYYIRSPQTWLDTQPGLQPEFPVAELPDDLEAYLYLLPHRLHVPEVYGLCRIGEAADASVVFLLENVPLDEKGMLYPAIVQAWANATAVRQVYWLWQLLELWRPLAEQGVCASLLVADNIRVEGWRVRLCQLFWDEGVLAGDAPNAEDVPTLNLADLAMVWLGWVDQAQPSIADSLRNLCYEMRVEGMKVETIAAQLNQLLLEQAAPLPLRLQTVGMSDTGPHHAHNEDTCYPLTTGKRLAAELPQLAIVCDGIGGHEGGEVASQLAVQSLQLQAQALLTEVAEQPEPFAPEVISQQLEAIVRVVNDLIANQNNAQGREARRRMGTTLVMGLQTPQRILTQGIVADNSHELYLVNVGDSRAYWITPRYCHQLTLDDDIAVREVRMGRLFYREALLRADAGALIQALGTRDSEFLHPAVQRFILEEDGVLLLCSDGLSDNGWVERAWSEIMADVFRGKRSLEAAATAWIDLANQNNGHDNVSVVLLQCHVSSPSPGLTLPEMEREPESGWTDSARALMPDGERAPAAEFVDQPVTKRQPARLLWFVLVATLLLAAGVGIWFQVNVSQPQPNREQVKP